MIFGVSTKLLNKFKYLRLDFHDNFLLTNDTNFNYLTLEIYNMFVLANYSKNHMIHVLNLSKKKILKSKCKVEYDSMICRMSCYYSM